MHQLKLSYLFFVSFVISKLTQVNRYNCECMGFSSFRINPENYEKIKIKIVIDLLITSNKRQRKIELFLFSTLNNPLTRTLFIVTSALERLNTKSYRPPKVQDGGYWSSIYCWNEKYAWASFQEANVLLSLKIVVILCTGLLLHQKSCLLKWRPVNISHSSLTSPPCAFGTHTRVMYISL